MTRRRTVERQYARAVKAFEEVQQRERETTAVLAAARESRDLLIRRLMNAMDSENHPLALKIESELKAATNDVDVLTRKVIALIRKIPPRAQAMCAIANRIADLPN